MSRTIHILCCVLCLGCCGLAQESSASHCQGSTVADYSAELTPKAKAFLAELKTAVQAVDKRKVAAMVKYPLRVNTGEGHKTIQSASKFLTEYDRLFTASVRKAITAQTPECLFANWQGVMIGNGEVWFSEQRDGSMKIHALNP